MSGLRDRLLRMRGSAALRDELRAGMPDSEEEQKEQESNSADAEKLGSAAAAAGLAAGANLNLIFTSGKRSRNREAGPGVDGAWRSINARPPKGLFCYEKSYIHTRIGMAFMGWMSCSRRRTGYPIFGNPKIGLLKRAIETSYHIPPHPQPMYREMQPKPT